VALAHPIVSWEGCNVLITGAAGFLGRSVTALLGTAERVVGLDLDWARPTEDSTSIERVTGDVRDNAVVEQVLADRKIDTVLHLAAQTLVGPALVDPVDTFRNNIEGTWSVLEACRSVGTVSSIVIASSDKAYGDWSGRPYREDTALRPRHPYDVSKAAGDLIGQTYATTYGLPVAITRCGNLYGGGDTNWSRVVPGTIRSVLEGQGPVIRSDGTPVRDYLHVSDAAAGALVLAGSMRNRPELSGTAFNFAAGSRLSVRQLVDRILSLMGSDLEPIVLAEAAYEIPEQRLSTLRARRVLHWRPRTGIDDGLREAIDWYGAHLTTVA
jgi:CDP-glucose 4,6-dehydratase